MRQYVFENDFDEIAAICCDIQEKIQSGVAPKDIAILVKKNKAMEQYMALLSYYGIPAHASQSESLFDTEIVGLIMKIFHFLVH
jgi:ATP-dependent exoDNAse (exonuclease V) beta subunit